MLKINTHIFNIMTRHSAYGKTSDLVLRRIRLAKRRWGGAFTPSDFADIADLRSVGMVLSRLVKTGTIQRVRRGVYEIPRPHPVLGTIGAGPDAVLAAIARRDGLTLLPSGAESANSLGLSTQVPARASYGVSDRARLVSLGGSGSARFQRRSSKRVALAGRASGRVAEALRSLGRKRIDSEKIRQLQRALPAEAKRELLEDLRYVPAWMRPVFREVAEK